jgi:hypothetical protein
LGGASPKKIEEKSSLGCLTGAEIFGGSLFKPHSLKRAVGQGKPGKLSKPALNDLMTIN